MEEQICKISGDYRGCHKKGITIYDVTEVSLKKSFNEQKGIYKYRRTVETTKIFIMIYFLFVLFNLFSDALYEL